MTFLPKNTLITLILIVLCNVGLVAQTNKSDSLITVLQSQKEDSNAVKTIHDICIAFINENNPQASLDYAKKGITMAERLKLGRQKINQYYHAGKACILLSNYDEAFKYLDYAIKNGKEYKKLYPQCLSAMGTVCIKQGDYPKAMDYLLESLKIKEEIRDSSGIVSTRSNIGNLYAKMKDRDKAMAEYKKCLSIAVHTSTRDLSNTYINIANAFVLFEKRDSSDYYLLKALVLCRKENDKKTLMVLLGNLGLNASEAGDTKKAEEYFFEAIKVCEEIGNKEFVGSTYNSLAELYLQNKDYNKAIHYGEQGLKMAVELGILSSELDARGVLYKSYKGAGKSVQALEQYEKLIVVRDSMLGAEKQKEVTRKELKFEYDKVEALQKAEQEKLDALAAEEKEKQRIIIYAIGAGFILLAAIAFIVFRSLQQNKKQNKIISLQKAMVEEKQKEILDSIHYAERIQKTLLANKEMIASYLPETFILFKPKDIVSGDFYWATSKTTKEGEQFYLTVADSTGHGVPGAFMSLLNISFLNEAINEKNLHHPNEALNHVRKRLMESMEGRQDGMDAVLMRFSSLNGKTSIEYAAAHNAPILISDGQLIHLKADKMPVGKGERKEDFTLHTVEVKKGDVLYLYTDGYPDQFGGAQGKKFKYKQLEALMLANSHLPLNEQEKILDEKFEEWRAWPNQQGGEQKLEQIDDVCIIGIRI